MGLNDTTPISL